MRSLARGVRFAVIIGPRDFLRGPRYVFRTTDGLFGNSPDVEGGFTFHKHVVTKRRGSAGQHPSNQQIRSLLEFLKQRARRNPSDSPSAKISYIGHADKG
jgi:hypothetical protein